MAPLGWLPFLARPEAFRLSKMCMPMAESHPATLKPEKGHEMTSLWRPLERVTKQETIRSRGHLASRSPMVQAPAFIFLCFRLSSIHAPPTLNLQNDLDLLSTGFIQYCFGLNIIVILQPLSRHATHHNPPESHRRNGRSHRRHADQCVH